MATLTNPFSNDTTASQTTTKGMAITTYAALYRVVSVTKDSLCTATSVAIRTTIGGSDLATASFSGDVATFATPYEVTADTEYYLIAKPTASAIDHRYKNNTGGTYPFGTGGSGSTFFFTAGVNDGVRQTANGFISNIT